jgi:hypothetical protein
MDKILLSSWSLGDGVRRFLNSKQLYCAKLASAGIPDLPVEFPIAIAVRLPASPSALLASDIFLGLGW